MCPTRKYWPSLLILGGTYPIICMVNLGFPKRGFAINKY
jgi:hypothetical protein